MTPRPPPGFELLPSSLETPAPPPGFEIIAESPLAPGYERKGGVLDKLFPDGVPKTYGGDPAPRVGDSLKPVFGGHNPIAETIDFVTPVLDVSRSEGRRSEDDDLSTADYLRKHGRFPSAFGSDRLKDTAAFVASAPFQTLRAPTPGQMVESATGYSGLKESEQSFADNNPALLQFLGGLGEVAPGVSWLRGMGAPTQAVQVPHVPGARTIARARANQGERGAYGNIVDDLTGTVDEFANQVAAGASRADVATNRRTLDILGEEMQRHAGNVSAAQQATINRIVQESGVTPQTAAAQIRRLSSVHEDSNLMLGEYPAVAASDAAQRLRRGENVNLDDLGRTIETPTQGTLDYLANNGNARSAKDVRNAVARRQEDLGPAMRGTLEDIGPRVETGPRSSRPANITDAQEFIDNARNIAREEYRAAYNEPINNAASLERLPRILNAHLDRAASRAGDPSRAIQRAVDQFYITLPTGQRIAMNTLQQLQDARGAIRGQISEYYRSGRTDLAAAVQPLYNQITALMQHMSPRWYAANARWRDMKFDEFAQELGDAFSTTAGPRFRQQMREFRQLAPEAQEIVRIHFLQKLYDKLDNLGDTHSVSKLFSNDHSRNMIRQLFGNEAAITFTRAVRDQKVAEASQRAMANSATHRRGQAQKQKDLDTGLTAAVENASARGVRNWLLERATQLLTERRNRPMARVLTTPMSDTAEVARHLHNMRVQQQNLSRFDQPNSIRMNETVPMGVGGAAENVASQDEQLTNETRFNPPMRLGGPKPAQGAFEPVAPTPGNVPQQAEARSYTPSPSESAAFYARRGAEAIGVPPSQAERIGSGVSTALNVLTPADDVSDAIETGSAASAAAAGLSFLPGFRAVKKSSGEIVRQAETVFDRLKQPMTHPVTGQVMRFAEGTDEWFSAARGEIRELEAALKEAGAEVKDFKFADLTSPKYWGNPKARSGERVRTEEYLRSLQKAVRRHIKEPYKGGTAVPAPTSSPNLEAAKRTVENVDNLRAPRAIPGRKGFPSLKETRELARGAVTHNLGPTPPRGSGPWDDLDEDMRVLREAYERVKRLPKPN